MPITIDEEEIYKLVKYNYYKYDYNYKLNPILHQPKR